MKEQSCYLGQKYPLTSDRVRDVCHGLGVAGPELAHASSSCDAGGGRVPAALPKETSHALTELRGEPAVRSVCYSTCRGRGPGAGTLGGHRRRPAPAPAPCRLLGQGARGGAAAMAAADVALAAPMSDTATPCPHLIVTVCYTYMRNSCRYLVLHCCIVVSLLQYNLRMARRCIAARFAPFLLRN